MKELTNSGINRLSPGLYIGDLRSVLKAIAICIQRAHCAFDALVIGLSTLRISELIREQRESNSGYVCLHLYIGYWLCAQAPAAKYVWVDDDADLWPRGNEKIT